MTASLADVRREMRARLDRERSRRASAARNWVPHMPFPKQAAFLALDAREALYGGAAGGGKSDTLLMDAAQFCHIEGFGALILRRTHKELILKGALMDRSHEWFGDTPARWNGDDKRWTFPSGATIEFGYFDTWSDRSRYQSAAWNRIYFDELTHFPEEWYRFMFTRIRRVAGFPVSSGMRAATNPGNVGHRWVGDRFPVAVSFEQQPEQRCPGHAKGASCWICSGRRFLFANFRDNPFIDQADYELQLAEAPPIVRRQMLGEWVDDGIGRVYASFDPSRNVVASPPEGGEWTYLLGIDFGIVDPNAFTVLGWRSHDPTIYVLQSYRKKGDPIDVAEEVGALMTRYPFSRIVGDLGGMGKAFAEQMGARHGIPIEPADKMNKLGYVSLLNGDLEKGRVLLVREACRELEAEWTSLQWAPNAQKEVGENHAADSCLYAWRAATAYSERSATPVARRTRDEQIRQETAAAWAETQREIEEQKRLDREEWEP